MANAPVISLVKIVSEEEPAISDIHVKGRDLLTDLTASLDRIEGYMCEPNPSIVMLKIRLRHELGCLRQLVYEISVA